MEAQIAFYVILGMAVLATLGVTAGTIFKKDYHPDGIIIVLFMAWIAVWILGAAIS